MRRSAAGILAVVVAALPACSPRSIEEPELPPRIDSTVSEPPGEPPFAAAIGRDSGGEAPERLPIDRIEGLRVLVENDAGEVTAVLEMGRAEPEAGGRFLRLIEPRCYLLSEHRGSLEEAKRRAEVVVSGPAGRFDRVAETVLVEEVRTVLRRETDLFAMGGEAPAAGGGSVPPETVVTADRLRFDLSSREGRYEGDVEVRRETGRLFCDRLDILVPEEGSTAPARWAAYGDPAVLVRGEERTESAVIASDGGGGVRFLGGEVRAWMGERLGGDASDE